MSKKLFGILLVILLTVTVAFAINVTDIQKFEKYVKFAYQTFPSVYFGEGFAQDQGVALTITRPGHRVLTHSGWPHIPAQKKSLLIS